MPTRSPSPQENADVTLMICSSDAYADLWDPFFLLLERYWPQAKSYPIILNTESKVYEKEGWNIRCFQFYKDRKAPSYGTRMLRHLREVKTPFVIWLLEDYFLRAPADQARIDLYVDAMKKDPAISSINFGYMGQPGFPSREFPGLQEYYPIARYRLSMQSTLWRTKDLKRTWKPGNTPWTWEAFSTRRTDRTKKKFYCMQENKNLVFDYGSKPTLCWGCIRGQWHRDDMVPFFAKEGIDFDFTKRGWFDFEAFTKENEAKQSQRNKLDKVKLLLTELYFGGFVFSCKRIGYGVIKRLFRLEKNYDAFMRARHNPPDGQLAPGE